MSSRSVQPDAMSTEVMAARIASLQAEMAAKAAEAAALAAKVTALEESLTDLAHENTLLKRRLFGIRTERSQTSELQLALGDLLATEAKLQAELDAAVEKGEAAPPAPPGTGTGTPRPHGRRNLFASNLPRVPVEIRNPELEAQGARLIRFEDSAQLGYRRGGFYVVVKRIAQYEVVEAGETTVVPAPPPSTLFPLARCTPRRWRTSSRRSSGWRAALPARARPAGSGHAARPRANVPLRRARRQHTGATVVAAMWRDAIATGQMISTDATGALIQPTKAKDGKSLACKKGHFFTAVVDADAVLFAYVERHTSEAVKALFGEFRGLLQADASAVYEVLARGRPPDTDDGVVLVGCWAHCRRYFFEAALCRHPPASRA
ncbi:MAG: transposase [Kofleriaceae bacterium]|nr:transposase [Kofleriaceae bacterium]